MRTSPVDSRCANELVEYTELAPARLFPTGSRACLPSSHHQPFESRDMRRWLRPTKPCVVRVDLQHG